MLSFKVRHKYDPLIAASVRLDQVFKAYAKWSHQGGFNDVLISLIVLGEMYMVGELVRTYFE